MSFHEIDDDLMIEVDTCRYHGQTLYANRSCVLCRDKRDELPDNMKPILSIAEKRRGNDDKAEQLLKEIRDSI